MKELFTLVFVGGIYTLLVILCVSGIKYMIKNSKSRQHKK